MKLLQIILIVSLVFSLSACAPSPEQLAASVNAALTATAESWTPTPTLTLTPVPTLTPTPPPTNTPKPTLTPTKTRRPTLTPIPSPTYDPNRYYSIDGKFSFINIEGWTEVDLGLKYPVLMGPKLGVGAPNLAFVTEDTLLGMAFYSATIQDNLKKLYPNIRDVSEEFLTTDDGKDYFRWAFYRSERGVALQQVAYFFQSGGLVLTVSYTRPRNEGKDLDAVIDASMKSMIFKR